ncbi:metallophosphoesterase family protein [Saccharicrinis aurantiacus]|uniref:metallophosphoesterase family protein n=1 Tax=Saccharicrinis aurantiacus TaxID=1849719 RepID=UPI00083805A7|nr:exonuclease subunit SbcD [Saccharicrinis aurantiacus]
MKILHTADWHIGKKLENFSRLAEQKDVLSEICAIADEEDVNAIIIAGDLFDNFNPASEATELFFKTLKNLSNNGNRPVIAISGNHDSPERIESPDSLARECGIVFMGFPHSKPNTFSLDSGLSLIKTEPGFLEFKIPNCNEPLRVIATPYANEHRIKTYLNQESKEQELRDFLSEHWNSLYNAHCDSKGVNILATHLFVIPQGSEVKEEAEDEKPIVHVGGAQAIYTKNFPPEIQYVALGHLHRNQNIGTDKQAIVYSGSPLSYSFAEANQQKYVSIINVKAGEQAKVSHIPLKKGKRLLRLKAENITDAVDQLSANQDSLIELTIKSDTYLTAADRKLLNESHQNIITLIPMVNITSSDNDLEQKTINPTLERAQLFKDYFEHVHGNKPNDEIIDLFNEVISNNSSNI